MTRTMASGEWPSVGMVLSTLGDRENGVGKAHRRSYLDPTPVPLGKKPKASRGTVGKGTRQFSGVR